MTNSIVLDSTNKAASIKFPLELVMDFLLLFKELLGLLVVGI